MTIKALVVSFCLIFPLTVFSANICIQSKETGLYVSKSQDAQSIKECNALNPKQIRSSEIVLSQPVPVPVPPPINSYADTRSVTTQPQRVNFRFESSDLSLKAALTRWVNVAGYQLAYEAEKDFPGRISADFGSDFELAVATATRAYRNTDYPLKSCIYDNKVLRVVRYLGTGKECEVN